MRRQDLEKRSTTVRMVVLPDELVKSVTKSMAMWDHGRWGTGSGWRSPAGRWREGLDVLHAVQLFTKIAVSLVIEGHQNRFLRS